MSAKERGTYQLALLCRETISANSFFPDHRRRKRLLDEFGAVGPEAVRSTQALVSQIDLYSFKKINTC
jgi:hypothetical protein